MPKMLTDEETQQEKAKELIAQHNQISTYQIDDAINEEEDAGFAVIRTQLEKQSLEKRILDRQLSVSADMACLEERKDNEPNAALEDHRFANTGRRSERE